MLILGSLPGDASLSASQYYAHPRNHFWRLLTGVIGKDLTVMDYSDRIAAVQMSGIALWDVVGIAERVGSLDHHIHNARPNDLREFVGRLPELRVIAFNGKKAATLAANVFDDMAIDVLQLPSSSPAYTVHLEVKAAVWAGLKGHLNVQK